METTDTRWVKYKYSGETFEILLPPYLTYEDISRKAKNGKHLLILGETGSGKDEIARLICSIERESDSKRPIGSINCRAIPPTLLQSELFGSAKGAYNDALDRSGILRSLNGGTLIMEELGRMAIEDQAILLQFLQSGIIRKVGSDTFDDKVSVRIIATTNVNILDPNVFLTDLRHRFRSQELHVIPLQERPADIGLLLNRFFPSDGFYKSISIRWLMELMRGKWPGNIRELHGSCEAIIDSVSDLPQTEQNQVVTRAVWERAVGPWQFGYDEDSIQTALQDGEPNQYSRPNYTCTARYILCRLWEEHQSDIIDDAKKRSDLCNSLKILACISEYPFIENSFDFSVPFSQLGTGSLNCASVFDSAVYPKESYELLDFLAIIHNCTEPNYAKISGYKESYYDYSGDVYELVDKHWPPSFLKEIQAFPEFDIPELTTEIPFEAKSKRGRKKGRDISDSQLIQRLERGWASKWTFLKIKADLGKAGYSPKTPNACRKRIERIESIDLEAKIKLLESFDQMLAGYPS